MIRSCLPSVLGLLLLSLPFTMSASDAPGPRIYVGSEMPEDVRFAPLKDLNGYFPFEPPKDRGVWNERRQKVMDRLKASQGLLPEPKRTPLNAVIHGKVDRGDYTVEKVYFESVPGFFVTGSLYRPAGKVSSDKKRPAILCPHGHWTNGRFYDSGDKAVKDLLAIGAERFESAAHNQMQARCVQLARMGCVVLQYDMIGYADCQQISFEVAHKFKTQRPEMNTDSNWGLFSPQAESRFQNLMGLQSWNSIRALDFLETLPDVDTDRLAVTGASGGGTQTFVLAALDERIDLSIPAVMVSTAMQGGCTCENASGLRVGTGNVEYAALFAPKPQGLVAANDWTKEMSTKGFPELQALYQLMGRKSNVMLWNNIHFRHNYNHVNRTSMYAWVNKHFKLGLETPVLERDFELMTEQELTVWDSEHPKPPAGPEVERRVLAHLEKDRVSTLNELARKPAAYRDLVGRGLGVVIDRSLADAGDVEWDLMDKTGRNGYLEMNGLIRNKAHGEETPVSFLYPEDWNGTSVLYLSKKGKAGAFIGDDVNYSPTDDVKALLNKGYTVIAMDVFYTGELVPQGGVPELAPKVENPREFAGYTHGYNHSVTTRRVHDVLSVLKLVTSHERPSMAIGMVALDGLGHVAAGALAQSGEAVDWAAVDLKEFRYGTVKDVRDLDFTPGAAAYDDVEGMLAVSGVDRLWIAGNDADFKRLKQVRSGKHELAKGAKKNAMKKVLQWLSRN